MNGSCLCFPVERHCLTPFVRFGVPYAAASLRLGVWGSLAARLINGRSGDETIAPSVTAVADQSGAAEVASRGNQTDA